MKKSLGARTLAWPNPVYLVGTYDHENKPNIMNAAWGGICSSEPPCLGVSVRPARHTYDAIMRRRAFTVSVPSVDLVKQADFFGIASGANLNKFEAAGLTPAPGELVAAPYVKECPLVLELELVHAIRLGSHIQFIGEIKDVKIDPNCLDEHGNPDIGLAAPILFDPALRNYHSVGPVLGKAYSLGKDLLPK